MVVTGLWMRLAFASLSSPEQTSLFPPSTAQRLACAPARDTAPVTEKRAIRTDMKPGGEKTTNTA